VVFDRMSNDDEVFHKLLDEASSAKVRAPLASGFDVRGSARPITRRPVVDPGLVRGSVEL